MKYLRTLRPVVQRLLLAMFACVVTSQWVAAQEAELRFTIKGGNKSALPIAVVPFASAGDSGSVDIAAVIRSDLAGKFVQAGAADDGQLDAADGCRGHPCSPGLLIVSTAHAIIRAKQGTRIASTMRKKKEPRAGRR